MTYPKNKKELVEIIIHENVNNPDFKWKDFPIDSLIFEWFVTGRTGSGLRLSDSGDAAFRTTGLAYYEFEFAHIKQKIHSVTTDVMKLDRFIHCPYYIFTKKIDSRGLEVYIRVYDHKVAFMINLYGDIMRYIESLSNPDNIEG